MKLPSLRKLGQGGFHLHLVAPLLAVVAVGAIGASYLALSRAATLSATLYQGSCAQTYELLHSSAASASAACTKDVQELIDIYQFSATSHFPITAPSSDEVFSYQGKMTMLTPAGGYNGATQNAVNTVAKTATGSLTNAAVTNGAINKGTWESFCETVAGKTGTTAFTGHTSYTFGSVTIPTSGASLFSTVCGTSKSKSFSTGTSSATSSTGTLCTSYTISQASNPTPSNSPCVYYLQTIVNAAWESNPYGYTAVAKAYSTYYKQNSSGPMGGVSAQERNYNQATSVRIMAFQAVTAYNGSPLSVTGTTDATTWDALCALAHTYGSGDSYIQAAKTVAAASDSGCSKVTGKISADAHQTTPPPLSCTGTGVDMNQAKTACGCTNSAQVYSGGKCVTPATTGTGSTGGTSGGTGGSGLPTVTSFNFTLGPEDQNFVENHDLYPDIYLATWTAQNTTACFIVTNANMQLSNSSSSTSSGSLSGKSEVALKPGQAYTITLTCSNSKGGTHAYHTVTTPIP